MMRPNEGPIRHLYAAPPLQIRRTGPDVWLSRDGDSLESGTVCVARLTAQETIEVEVEEETTEYTVWEWEEVVPVPGGQWEALEGGRTGDKDRNPAFTLENANAGVNDIAILRPGAINDRHGLEWLFQCGCPPRCVPGSATKGKILIVTWADSELPVASYFQSTHEAQMVDIGEDASWVVVEKYTGDDGPSTTDLSEYTLIYILIGLATTMRPEPAMWDALAGWLNRGGRRLVISGEFKSPVSTVFGESVRQANLAASHVGTSMTLTASQDTGPTGCAASATSSTTHRFTETLTGLRYGAASEVEGGTWFLRAASPPEYAIASSEIIGCSEVILSGDSSIWTSDPCQLPVPTRGTFYRRFYPYDEAGGIPV